MNEKRYRECMSEIIGVLKKYDMAGAITIVSKERAMFKYHFPTQSPDRAIEHDRAAEFSAAADMSERDEE